MDYNNILRKRSFPLIFLGLLVSLYLSHHHIEVNSNLQVGASICTFDEIFDCDSVAKSVYSEIFGVPVAFFGAFYFSSILLLLLFARGSNKSFSRSLNFILYIIFGFAFIGSLIFAYYSYVELGKVCLFCSLLYLINISLFILAHFVKEERGDVRSGFMDFTFNFLFSSRGLFFLLGNLGLILLLVHLPTAYKKYVLIPRYLSVYDASVIGELVDSWEKSEARFDSSLALKLPGAIIRSPQASVSQEKVTSIVEFADYECPFCQRISPVLEKVYSGNLTRVSMVFLQFPLDRSCNRSIGGDFHQSSCRIARTVLCAGLDYGMSSLEIHSQVFGEKIDNKEALDKLILELGIDESKCEKADQALSEQIEFAIAAGVLSTPSIFVNGKIIEFKSFPQIEAILQAIINRN